MRSACQENDRCTPSGTILKKPTPCQLEDPNTPLASARLEGLDGWRVDVQRFRDGLVFKAHRLCVALNFGLASNKEEEKDGQEAAALSPHSDRKRARSPHGGVRGFRCLQVLRVTWPNLHHMRALKLIA